MALALPNFLCQNKKVKGSKDPNEPYLRSTVLLLTHRAETNVKCYWWIKKNTICLDRKLTANSLSFCRCCSNQQLWGTLLICAFPPCLVGQQYGTKGQHEEPANKHTVPESPQITTQKIC